MATKNEAIEFFNKNGFYLATSKEQKDVAEQLVKDGILKLAEADCFKHPSIAGNFYVHPYVDCKHKMPATLHKIVYGEPDFYEGEIILIELNIESQIVDVYAKFSRQFTRKDGKKMALVTTLMDHSEIVVDFNKIIRCFKMDD